MVKLHFVGFNGYKQCPNHGKESNKVIGEWSLIEFETILNLCCLHRFTVIETDKKVKVFGMHDLLCNEDIGKPLKFGSLESSDNFIIASEQNNLWKYSFDDCKWIKLNVKFLNEQEEAAWKEKENKITKLSYCLNMRVVVILQKNGSVWLLSNENCLKLHYPNDIDRAIDIASGLEHSLILTESGCVLSFGNGSRGQLGNGSLNSNTEPVQIPLLEGLKVIKIAAGGWHSCAVTDSADICVWGWNNYGQLSAFEENEEIPLSAVPVFIDIIKNKETKVLDVACGSRHTVVMLENGQIYASGWNSYKQLGIESSEEKIVKFKRSKINGSPMSKLYCGPWYTILLDGFSEKMK